MRICQIENCDKPIQLAFPRVDYCEEHWNELCAFYRKKREAKVLAINTLIEILRAIKSIANDDDACIWMDDAPDQIINLVDEALAMLVE